MDGLHKLIEMLEKRWGRLAADVMLFIVVAGAMAWAINNIFQYLLIPLYRIAVSAYAAVAGAHLYIPSADVVGPLLDGVIALFSGVLGGFTIITLRQRDKEAYQFMRQEVPELLAANKRLKEENAELRARLDDLLP